MWKIQSLIAALTSFHFSFLLNIFHSHTAPFSFVTWWILSIFGVLRNIIAHSPLHTCPKSFWYASFIFNKTKFSNPILYLIFFFFVTSIWPLSIFPSAIFSNMNFHFFFVMVYTMIFQILRWIWLLISIKSMLICLWLWEKNNDFTLNIICLRIELGTFNHKNSGFFKFIHFVKTIFVSQIHKTSKKEN